jgi:hypothetical protein
VRERREVVVRRGGRATLPLGCVRTTLAVVGHDMRRETPRVRLRSGGGTLRDVRVRLVRGGRTVATARRPSMRGERVLRLHRRARLALGPAKVIVTAVDPAGRTLVRTSSARVR